MKIQNHLSHLGAGALLLAVWFSGPVHAQLSETDRLFPQISVDRIILGPQIVKELGSRMPALARWYGHSEADFRALCEREKTLRMDRQGRLHYVCPGLEAGQAALTAGVGTAPTLRYPDSETFLLHSKPGATKVIYLDFNGHTTTGTSWNSNYTGGAPIVTPIYSVDADSAFSSTELGNIQEIWQRVTEDYAPFNVDVTTQDPGIEALRKTNVSDANFGVRVCIGGSSADWFGASAGGVAYLGSFSWNSDTPAFVFPAQLSNGFPKYTAEACSHESGHTFNLSHDGQTGGVEYYEGQNGWAPIMGVGYYVTIVQWSKGEYTKANNKQDDTALISGITGYRVDDHGQTGKTATLLTGLKPLSSGVIEKPADVDVFKFTTGAGNISFKAEGADPSPNLTVRLRLYNSKGAMLTETTTLLSFANIAINVAQGTYYLAVDGIGAGSPTTSYSDYGSLGQFTLEGKLR